MGIILAAVGTFLVLLSKEDLEARKARPRSSVTTQSAAAAADSSVSADAATPSVRTGQPTASSP